MIVGIVGGIGSGKTLLMTYLANKYCRAGYTVLSNYRLKIPHTLISQELILNYAESNNPIHDCVMLLDEAHIILDCRRSFKNTITSYLLLQSRKRRVNILYTTQNRGQVDIRLRDQSDFILECKPVYKPKTHPKVLDYVIVSINKCLGHDTFRSVRKIVLRHPERIFPLYDTYEIVNFEKPVKTA